MFNVMLDPLPYEWNGYPIDADFQIGIQISQCMADDSLSDVERFDTAAGLLFPEETPSPQEIQEAIHWFLTEYNHDNSSGKKESKEVILDFDIDQWRIYAAFRSQYGIDLNTAELHWFVFMGLLSNLNECALTHVMNIRGKKITSRMSRAEKESLKEAKKIFAIKQQLKGEPLLSAEEQLAVDEFMKYANINR